MYTAKLGENMWSVWQLGKYSDQEDTVYSLEPEFKLLDVVGDDKYVEQSDGYDEKHHLSGIDEQVSELYLTIKKELLSKNPDLIFNHTKSYISIKDRETYGYVKFSKKKMRIVFMCNEDNIRKKIQDYEIKSLAPRVQKFWNGECAEVIIENKSGIKQVTRLFLDLLESN